MKKNKSHVIKEKIRKVLKFLSKMPQYFWFNIKSMFVRNKQTTFENELAICAIVKNEEQYIVEWIKHHINIGVSKIYIFDNDSTDSTYYKIKPFIKKGFIVYERIHGKYKQFDAYNIALKKYRYQSKYIAFIDVDEFLMPCNTKDNIIEIIDSIISSNKKIGGLGVNWRMYGSSGYEKKPQGFVLANFLHRADDLTGKGNECIKSIVNPRKAFMFFSAHYPIYLLGNYEVDENGDKCNKATAKPKVLHKIRLNHYFTKSKEEWIKRRSLGRPDKYYVEENKRTLDDFREHDNNDIYDDIGLYYADLIKRRF